MDRRQQYSREKLSDADRRELNDSLKKAFSILKQIRGIDIKKSEQLMDQLNAMNVAANQTELIF